MRGQCDIKNNSKSILRPKIRSLAQGFPEKKVRSRMAAVGNKQSVEAIDQCGENEVNVGLSGRVTHDSDPPGLAGEGT